MHPAAPCRPCCNRSAGSVDAFAVSAGGSLEKSSVLGTWLLLPRKTAVFQRRFPSGCEINMARCRARPRAAGKPRHSQQRGLGEPVGGCLGGFGAHCCASCLLQGEEQDVERRGGTAGGDAPLSARLRVTAHWVLWAAGKGLAIVLLALAGGSGTGEGVCGECGGSLDGGCG